MGTASVWRIAGQQPCSTVYHARAGPHATFWVAQLNITLTHLPCSLLLL